MTIKSMSKKKFIFIKLTQSTWKLFLMLYYNLFREIKKHDLINSCITLIYKDFIGGKVILKDSFDCAIGKSNS